MFHLVGLSQDSRFLGRTFQDLLEPDQRKLKNAVLRSFIVQQLDPNDDTSMYHIFEHLNTGGTLLANQEIRNCVYHGRLVEHLVKLNQLQEWRQILGKTAPDARKRDIELLVRFFAMRDLSSYQKPMKDFLSKFMRRNKDTSEQVLEHDGEVFRETCKQLKGALGEKPFHVHSGLNAAVADAVMVAFSNHIGSVPKDIHERYQRLLEDEGFKDSTSKGTTDVNIVRGRFAKADLVLFG